MIRFAWPGPRPAPRSQALLVLLGALILSPLAQATTPPTRPVVKTGTASAITYQSADLGGTVNPSGQLTTYFFQYGLTPKYGGQSPPASLGAVSRTTGVTSPIGGLLPRTKYHYRLVAVNAAGTALGADATFTTAAIPLSLAIGALPSPVTFGAPLSVVGTLSGTGAAARAVVLQENPFPFTGGFRNLGNPELTSPTGAFQFNLLSLPASTQLRVVSVGSGPPVFSATLTEEVQLAVTMRVSRGRGARGFSRVRFSGLIRPAEAGARTSVQRLVGSRWKLVAATTSRPAAADSSRYSKTLNLRHGGFYRVFVRPVEGAHVASFSQPLLVHAARPR